MMRIVRITTALLLWLAALYGVLQLRTMADHAGPVHTICGPWGCGPPVMALVAWHGFWIILALLPTGIIIRRSRPLPLQRAGLALVLLAVAGLIVVAIWQAVAWLPEVRPDVRAYFPQRCLFVFVTLTDVPLVPALLIGAFVWGCGSAKRLLCADR